MNREERVRAAVEGRQPDRVPVSVWMHISCLLYTSRCV